MTRKRFTELVREVSRAHGKAPTTQAELEQKGDADGAAEPLRAVMG